tara:strand:+ start:75 stop:575 length:501 start_codon:yes stop_codon:yes gene_type:complete
MGNRVGLARTQALLENLKRELSLQGATLGGVVRKVKSVTSATTLTNSDSGAIVDMSGGAYAINLPQSPETGCTFTFTHTTAISGARTIDAYADNHYFKGLFKDHETASPAHVTFNGSSHDRINIAAATANHHLVTVTYVGSSTWLITDSWSHDISDVTVGADSGNS